MSPTSDREARTLDELLKLRAARMPDAPIAAYPTSPEPDSYQLHTAGQLDQYATRAAHAYRAVFGNRERSAPERVVALLATSDLDYLVAQFALGRLGFTVLLLSPRLSPAAVSNLLQQTRCQDLVHSEALLVKAQAVATLHGPLRAAALFTDYRSGPVPELAIDLDLDFETHTSCNILHSSGSTGFPKPIRNVHESFIYNAKNHFDRRGFITLPLFHNHGMSSFYRALYAGKVLYFYDPNVPLSERKLTAVLRHLGSELQIFYGVPYALKLLATAQGIELLKRFEIVMFGGSACPDALGELLVNRGVSLVSHYGATEVGQLMTSFREAGDKEWNWLRPPAALLPYLQWRPRGDALEAVIADGWKSKVTSNQPDGSYATRDLFVRHPTKNDRFKYVGRLDDWLVLVNGEKLNPVQFEQTVQSDPRVAEAVVFGAGQPAAGLMIVPTRDHEALSEDEFLELVRPTIDAANAQAEAHAQIAPEHIRVLAPDAIVDCPKTDKGTVIRAAFYKKFEPLIHAVYEDAQATSGGSHELAEGEMRPWLRNLLLEVTKATPVDAVRFTDDTDFFTLGLDSLGAYRVFSRIVKALDLGGRAAEVPGNVCFEYPNLRALGSYLSALGRGETYRKGSELEEMQALIDAYGTFAARPVESAGAPRVVLLTGATGSLGAHLLHQLLQVPGVEKVYCLNRGSNPQARTRESLELRGLDATLERVESFSADLTRPDFGVDPELLRGVNLVIHNAWSVNFNLGVASFDGQVQGLRHLLDFGFEVGARCFFVSSVSAAARSAPVVPEQHLNRLTDAQEMGYARSKLVGERLCQRAHEAGLDARVLRVGQIVGDTRRGQWNATEAIPLIIRSAVSIGALPALNDKLTWMPIDLVAQTVVDICQTSERHDVYHVVNPRALDWSAELLPMLASAGLKFEAVSPRTWLERLAHGNPDPAVNPTIKLLDFFKAKYTKPRTGPGVFYETCVTERVSDTLRAVSAPDADLVRKMVEYWTTEAWK
jgi:thioester reductase-like protein